MPITIHLAIIGAGPLGRRLALQAAQAGFPVILEDVMPSTLRHAEESLRQQLNSNAMPLVRFAMTVEEAVRQADLAIDFVPDELESKLEIFSLMDRMAPPRTVFATPTLNLSIADLASCTYRPGQCIGMAIHADQLTLDLPTDRRLPIRITSKTTLQAQSIVTEFWEALGYSPQVELDQAEAQLR
jgi:3-hydroxybutyryl-CoA dehydrogenase